MLASGGGSGLGGSCDVTFGVYVNVCECCNSGWALNNKIQVDVAMRYEFSI